MRVLWWLALCLMLAGCSPTSAINMLSTEEERQLVLSFVEELRTGQTDRLIEKLPTDLRDDAGAAAAQTHSLLENVGGSYKIQHVSTLWDRDQGSRKIFLVEGGADRQWAVIRVDLTTDQHPPKIIGFFTTPMDNSPSVAMTFNHGKAGGIGYLWIGAMLANVTLCVMALVAIWRRKWLKRRWLWTIGSILGVTAFQLNWASGEWAFAPFQIMFLGASFMKAGAFDPWILGFSIPLLPAIILWKLARTEIHPEKMNSVDGA